MADEPQLKQGSQGEWVEYAQGRLEAHGIDTGPIDGIFGPITDRAVREFQEKMGLDVDGIIGPNTWEALDMEPSGSDSDDEREDFTIEWALGYVEQTDDETCWAAATAMLLGRTDDREIVREVTGHDPSDDQNDGATQVELDRVAAHYGFSQVYPVCQDQFGWAEWLGEGPLLVVVPGNEYHAVVIAGVYATEREGESMLLFYDPWPGNGVRWLPFDAANSEYEIAGEEWINNVFRN